jgi:hypothetical protein
MISFWSNDFTVIFNKNYITELWPSPEMTYEQKLNAITRCVLLLTFLGFVATMKFSLLLVGFLTLGVIYFMFKQRKVKATKEGFGAVIRNDPPIKLRTSEDVKEVVESEFDSGTKRNPFGNVLLTDIMDNPDKRSAPPSFNPDVEENITKNVKRSVQMMNPSIENTNKQLYGDLWQNFQLDQSNRLFYSTANTKVVNDQGAFADFLYGNMPSAKESTPEGDMQRVKDSYRYILY